MVVKYMHHGDDLVEHRTRENFGRLAQFIQLIITFLSVRKVWGSILGPVKPDTVSPTASPFCDVSSELCRRGAKP